MRIPDLKLYLLDGRAEPAPLGVAAEIYVGGAGVARGYLGRPALTATRFVPDPYSNISGSRLYRSGDLGRFRGEHPDLDYAGRCDFQVKIRGYRVELGEIEAVLSALEGVHDAVVLVREDLPGISGQHLVAYLVTENGVMLPSPGDLHEQLARVLPDYMVPGHFVFLKSLPLTAHGKVDRRLLPAPERVGAKEERVSGLARTPVETRLVAIWASVLGIAEVGIHDRFFELGGDSILSIRVMTAAKSEGMFFSLPQLFEAQTIAALAPLVVAGDVEEPAGQEAFSLISATDRDALPDAIVDAYPATELQKGMLFHGELEQDSYHNLTGFHLQASYDRDLLIQAAAALIEHHPVLRTSFDLAHYAEPLQLVHEVIATPIFFEDLSRLDDEAQERALDLFFEREKHNRFDWSAAGLLRLHVHRRGPQSFQLTLTEHHAIVDGWSVASLLVELLTIYLALHNPDMDPHH